MEERVRRLPRVTIPCFQVERVALAAGGALPTGCTGLYPHHDAMLADYLRLAEALDDPTSVATVCWYLAHFQIARGELHEAVRVTERGLALARQWSLPYFSVLHSGSLGYAYVLLGRTAEGIALLEQATNALGTMGHRSGQALLTLRLGEACVLAGRLEDAFQLLFGRPGEHSGIIVDSCGKGRHRNARGRADSFQHQGEENRQQQQGLTGRHDSGSG